MNIINWDRLQELLLAGARDAFTAVRREHPDKELFGYCLYSDDSGTTMLHAVGHCEQGRPTLEDDEYWNPHEWELQDGLDCLGPALQLITQYYQLTPDTEPDEIAFRDHVYDAAVAALAELRASGFFATSGAEAYVLFSVADWDEKDVLPWVEQLNPGPVVEAYRTWMAANYVAPTAPALPTDPQTGTLSDFEQQYLCAALCGQQDQLAEMHATGVPTWLADEALVLAAWKGKADVCSYLLSAGANTAHRGYRGKTALEFATQEGRKRVLPLLAAAEPSPIETARPERGKLDQEIFYLVSVVIPAQRAARG